MSATQDLIIREPALQIVQDGNSEYHRFCDTEAKNYSLGDPTGISCEEGDLLYGLVRISRPKFVLETGTNIGISTRYIALALEHNKDNGKVITIEHDSYVANYARKRLSKNYGNIIVLEGDSLSAVLNEEPDFMWLDTEPPIRYKELIRFLPQLKVRGFACIHDLWDLNSPMFGKFPWELVSLVLKGILSVVFFKTVHGVTVFQKQEEGGTLQDIMSIMQKSY